LTIIDHQSLAIMSFILSELGLQTKPLPSEQLDDWFEEWLEKQPNVNQSRLPLIPWKLRFFAFERGRLNIYDREKVIDRVG